MAPISEKELTFAAKNGVIKRLRVEQQDDGSYALIAQMTKDARELILTTQRKQVRVWVHLDLLMAYIRDRYGITSGIDVTLKGDGK